MDMHIISNIFSTYIHHKPQSVKRCAVGIGNQVYIVECDNVKYILRCSTKDNAYSDTIHWLAELSALDIPVPKVLYYGKNGVIKLLNNQIPSCQTHGKRSLGIRLYFNC